MTVELPFVEAAHLPAAVAAVRELTRQHGVTALPTETFYGLAVDPRDGHAVERVFTLKGRPRTKALLVVAGSLQDLEDLVEVPPHWRARLDAAWPAPLSVVLPVRRPLPAGGTTLAVRVPSLPLLRLLLSRVGTLTATSANRAGASPPSTPEGVRAAWPSGLDLLLNGGETAGGVPSTLLDCTGPVAVVLRAGAWEVPRDWPVKTA